MNLKKILIFRRASALLLAFGVLFSCVFLFDAIYAFDDTYLFGRFSSAIDAAGYLRGAARIFFGADLPSEYRTYGLSRVFHLFLYIFFGRELWLYELVICLSQVCVALVLIKLAHFYRVYAPLDLAVALTWLLVPFSLNWSFHHYTYALLPFQIVIISFYYLVSVRSPSIVALLCMGVSLALTGEFQLAAVPVMLGAAFLERRANGQSMVPIYILGIIFVVSLLIHRMTWVVYFQDPSAAQRFSFSWAGWNEVIARASVAGLSVWRSIIHQLELVGNLRFGIAIGVAMAAFTICAPALRGEKASEFYRDQSFKPFCLFLGLSLGSLAIYFILSLSTGQVFYEMPRRYGYGSLSLISVSIVFLGASLFRPYRKPYALVVILLVTSSAVQALFIDIPAARAVDRSIVERVKASLARAPVESRGVYVFVANNLSYEIGNADGGTVGPTFFGQTEAELSQSPFAFYWTTQGYLVHILNAKFVAMSPSDDGASDLNALSRPPLSKGYPDGVVLANLRLSDLDSKDWGSVIFDSYSLFSANKFSRRIDRSLYGATLRGHEEMVIDLGDIQNSRQGIFVDKAYGAPSGSLSSWVSDYGYLDSEQGTYKNDAVAKYLPYYQTNRNGAVVYKVSFRSPTRFEASFDFWEQWGRVPGERIFDLEVSWDGQEWVKVGRIDPAAINGNQSFSVVISRAAATSMEFRLIKIKGDVPMIQGLRLSRLD